MDRGAWWAMVHGAARVSGLSTKLPPPCQIYFNNLKNASYFHNTISKWQGWDSNKGTSYV